MKRKIRLYAIIISGLLHLAFFFIWVLAIILKLFSSEIKKPAVEEPIVFDLQQPTPHRRPSEVIETPDDAPLTNQPTQADYLSDKNALARNEQSPDDVPISGQPFAIGDLAAAEMPTPHGPTGEGGQGAATKNLSDQKEDGRDRKQANGHDFPVRKDASDFSREALIRASDSRAPGQPQNTMRAMYDNQMSRALENGGLSFNTYDWDFAPYMIWLKRRVEQNIFPPPAYTRMGMIEGETHLQFRIYPGGQLRNLVVVKFQGHEILMKTSRDAIEISAPFKPLPSDFPEKYLEVNAVFTYKVSKRPQRGHSTQ